MTSNFVFHEAFDSTRTADRHSAPNLAQAQAEALVSLLLGHSLSLTNTYAFDSRGVLDLVRAVLSARDDVTGALRAGSAGHRRLLAARPFLLCWFGADSFFGACAGQLRRMDPKQPDNRFLLSAWNAIDLDYQRRCDLADTLLSGPDPKPPKWLEEYADLPGHFDAVTMINRYARAHDRGRPASRENAVDVIDYLDHFRQLGAAGELRGLAARWDCPEDVAVKLWERIDYELKQSDGRSKLSNRSWIHVAVRTARDEDRDRDVLVQLKEMIDTFYNARLAQSGYADHDFLSSVPRTSDTEELQSVNMLAVNVIDHRRADVARPPLEGVFTAPADEPQLEVAPLRQLFRVYWDIIGEDDRRRTWQESCDAVNDLLARRPETAADEKDPDAKRKAKVYHDWAQRFRHAWASHMTLLSRQLPDIVRTDDRTLQVTVRQGDSVFRHSHRVTGEETQALTPAEVDALLATGGYVSKITSWVNV
jgi:hypothetical protein